MPAPTLTTRLAHAIIRRYPRRWRAEYGEELHAFIDDVPPRWRGVFDLARGCAVERGRAIVAPEEHPARAAMVLVALRALPPLAIWAATVAVGDSLRAVVGPPPDVVVTGQSYVLILLVGLGSWLFFGFIRNRHKSDEQRRWPRLSHSVAWLATIVVVLVVMAWMNDEPRSPRDWMISGYLGVLYLRFALSLVSPRGKRRVERLLHLDGLRVQIRRARREVNRCEENLRRRTRFERRLGLAPLFATDGAEVDLTLARRKLTEHERQHAETLAQLREMSVPRVRGG